MSLLLNYNPAITPFSRNFFINSKKYFQKSYNIIQSRENENKMYIAPVSNQNNSQVNFNGYVGSSMKKYVNSQLQRDLERLNTNDKQYGPFANTGILIDKVKKCIIK